MRRILFLARAEVLHIVRDKTTMGQVLVVPIIQLLVLVHAATFVISGTPTAIVDHDRSASSRGLVSRLGASGTFEVVSRPSSARAAEEALLAGEVALVVTIPQDFETSLWRDGRAPVHLVVDGERGSAAGIIQSYATRIVARYSAELAADRAPGAAAASRTESPPRRGVPRVDVRMRGWYNPALDYKHYMVPGILVALVTIIGTLLAAQNIAREHELGTLEQLHVTPIGRGELIAAKLLPLWVLGLFDLGVGLVVGRLVFDVPIRGSLLLLFAAAAIYLVAALAIGLLVSTVVRTQQQAMFVTFFILNVYLLLSGLFTPIDSMAPWVRVVSWLNPVRHFVTLSRAVLVKGAGLGEVAEPLAMLTLFALALLALAVRQVSKRTL
ncbi:MAG TPA: ABC transporter permease [Thermoanaerobaculia bacterium]|nr:ABC transporter permease [Thermoanaerobaculia bacterium]